MDHARNIKAFVSQQVNVDCDAAFDEALPRPKKIAFNSPVPMAATTNLLTTDAPPKQAVRLHEDNNGGNGQSVTIPGIPKTHSVVLAADLNRWRNNSRKLCRMRSKLQQKQHSTDSLPGQSLWAIAMAAVPVLANSAAQFLLPLVSIAFFHDTGLFDKLDIELPFSCFLWTWSFRKFAVQQAVRDAITLGNDMLDSKIGIAVNKGNEKGIGHFAKLLSKQKPDGGICLCSVDVDASGGTSEQCAAALQSFANKLKNGNGDNMHELHGQNAGSGGGGTPRVFIWQWSIWVSLLRQECLIVSCAVHASHTQLKNAVQNTFGTGAAF